MARCRAGTDGRFGQPLAVQFRQADLIQVIAQILEEENLPASHLELELTESVTMDNPLEAISVMGQLHELGVRMAIDDFGTGYSSMSYLKRFQVHKLKIDQSFVHDLPYRPGRRSDRHGHHQSWRAAWA